MKNSPSESMMGIYIEESYKKECIYSKGKL